MTRRRRTGFGFQFKGSIEEALSFMAEARGYRMRPEEFLFQNGPKVELFLPTYEREVKGHGDYPRFMRDIYRKGGWRPRSRLSIGELRLNPSREELNEDKAIGEMILGRRVPVFSSTQPMGLPKEAYILLKDRFLRLYESDGPLEPEPIDIKVD